MNQYDDTSRETSKNSMSMKRKCASLLIIGSLLSPWTMAFADENSPDVSTQVASAQLNGKTYNGTSGSETASTVLGNAVNFGITARNWKFDEAETNAAIEHADASGQSGNDMTNKGVWQPWVIGSIDGDFILKGDTAADVYSTADAYPHYTKNRNVGINYNDVSKNDVDKYIENMMDYTSTVSDELSQKNSFDGEWTAPSTDGRDAGHMTTDYVLDFSGYGSGTYYVNATDLLGEFDIGNEWWHGKTSINDGGLKIKKTPDQTIVMNIDSDKVVLKKYMISNDGSDNYIGSDVANQSIAGGASGVIWNMPNATSVETVGGVSGVFIAPKAKFRNNNTSAGWLIADSVDSSGGKEWHDINQWHSDSGYTKIGGNIRAKKTLNGGDLSDGEFSFEATDDDGTIMGKGTNESDGDVYINVSNTDMLEDGDMPITISEVNDGNAGIEYDASKHEMTANITTYAGKKCIDVSPIESEFINTVSNTEENGNENSGNDNTNTDNDSNANNDNINAVTNENGNVNVNSGTSENIDARNTEDSTSDNTNDTRTDNNTSNNDVNNNVNTDHSNTGINESGNENIINDNSGNANLDDEKQSENLNEDNKNDNVTDEQNESNTETTNKVKVTVKYTTKHTMMEYTLEKKDDTSSQSTIIDTKTSDNNGNVVYENEELEQDVSHHVTNGSDDTSQDFKVREASDGSTEIAVDDHNFSDGYSEYKKMDSNEITVTSINNDNNNDSDNNTAVNENESNNDNTMNTNDNMASQNESMDSNTNNSENSTVNIDNNDDNWNGGTGNTDNDNTEIPSNDNQPANDVNQQVNAGDADDDNNDNDNDNADNKHGDDAANSSINESTQDNANNTITNTNGDTGTEETGENVNVNETNKNEPDGNENSNTVEKKNDDVPNDSDDSGTANDSTNNNDNSNSAGTNDNGTNDETNDNDSTDAQSDNSTMLPQTGDTVPLAPFIAFMSAIAGVCASIVRRLHRR